MNSADHSIHALGPDTWDAYAALIERHNGILGGCWRTRFHAERDQIEPGSGYEAGTRMKRQLVQQRIAHAAVVMLDGEAIAWAQYGTPRELPNIHHRKQYLAEADLLPDYRVTCIFVD